MAAPSLDLIDLVSMVMFLVVFLGTTAGVLFFFRRLDRDSRRTTARLRGLAPGTGLKSENASVSDLALSALPRVGTLLLPGREKERAPLQARLLQAGFYGPQVLRLLLGAQFVLLVLLPLVCGLGPWLGGLLSGRHAALLGTAAAGVALVLPGLWLDYQKGRRQSALRRALPDALDMFVLCMEGGQSLLATIQRVTSELQVAHGVLAAEMNIVQREIQLGLSPGEAFKKLGDRCDLEEVRNLASVLLQSERFGASVGRALRLHADACRQERQQRAEEMAQKASVKILFPTLLCIFPAIFIVLLGPAAYQIAGMFSKVN
jgi:tight adherence protein C